MNFKEIIAAILWIVTFSAFGISILSFWTFHRMKSVPKKERNLLEYQKTHQYITLGWITLGVALVSLLITLWLS